MKATILLLLAFLTLLVPAQLPAQTFNPKNYWTFDDPSQPMKDQMNQFNLDPNFYQSAYTLNTNLGGTGVGKYMTLGQGGDILRAGQLAVNTSFTIEFLFRPGYGFSETRFFYRLDDAITIRMGYPYILFQTRIQTTSGGMAYDDLSVSLDGIGKKTYGYFINGDWHHIVFKYNSGTGIKEVWIDGQLPDGFSKVTPTGSFVNNTSVNRDLILNTNVKYQLYYGDYDEIAIYDYELPANMIYRHYLDFKANNHYSFNNSTQPVPAADPVTGPVDLFEYPPGHPAVSVSMLDQINTFPVPRYATGHTLLPNFNWMDPVYFSGRFQPGISEPQSVANSVELQKALAGDFNYMLYVSNNANAWNDAWIFMANQNPQWKLSTILLRAQLPNNKIWSQSLPNDHYLQNASGQFIDANGNVTSNKIWRPTAPLSSYQYDGKDMLAYINTNLTGKLSRPIDFVNENGEVFPLISPTAMAQDPQVTAAKNASGLDWETFLALKYKEHSTTPYRDQFLTPASVFNASTKYSEYRIDGHRDWQFRYEQSRYINTPINGKYYSTLDFYVRWPGNWKRWQGPWHGWQWVVESRHHEMALGDSLFSPFVAAGWDQDNEKNVRPAQWLGLLKSLNMMGAEFFYTGYFNEQSNYHPPNPPPYDPKGYAWQAVMPSYAQAVASRYEDLLRNGMVLEGDVLSDPYNPSSFKAYNFWTGDPRQIVTVRKDRTKNKYVITGTVQPNTNMAGNAEIERHSTITLDGRSLKFNVRRQGSTYLFDNTNTSAPVFYQLDGWHEATHPYRWSQDFLLEGELFDNKNNQVAIKTEVPAGTPAYDFTEFTSYVTFNTASDVVYNFQPRAAVKDYYFWVRARSKNGVTTGLTVTLDGGNAKIMECIRDTVWTWYRFDRANTVIEYPNVMPANHTLRITPLNTSLEIDAIALTTAGGPVFGNNPAPCGTGAATITPGGPTVFCQGGSVSLAASSGAWYLWSTGATSQSITVNTSGSYTVTVAGNVSAPVQVVANPLPSAIITPGGPTSFCLGGNVTLSANAGASWLWTPGNQTTQSISVSSAGTYTVRVTDNNGCSRVSTGMSVATLALPSNAVSGNGPLDFCDGGSVTLTATANGSYQWFPGGETTKSITVYATDDYQVQITGSNGCSATSSLYQVNVYKLPSAFVSANGPLSFVQGGSVVLTATAANSYLWAPGSETTQSITVTNSGTYSVWVTDMNGCSNVSDPVVVSVAGNTNPVIVISGPTTFCQGGSVTLTAPPGTSYLWSNGATSQSINASSPGQYWVTVYSGASSFTTQPETVTVNPLPAAFITASGPTSFCNGGGVALQANQASSYLWLPGGQTSQAIYVSAAGTYAVRTTNIYGCSAVSPGTTVTIASNCPCPIPTGLYDSNVSSSFATLNWTPVQGVDSLQIFTYMIYPRRKTYMTGAFSGTFSNITIAVLPNSWYFWRIRAKCGGTWTYWSPYDLLITPVLKLASGVQPDAVTEAVEIWLDPQAEAALWNETGPGKMTLFPNPARESVTCTFTGIAEGNGEALIRDFAGKVLYRRSVYVQEGENHLNVQFGDIAPGIYLMQLTGNGLGHQQKFVVH